MANWQKIDDSRIRHVWVRALGDPCREIYGADGIAVVGHRKENTEEDIQVVPPESYAEVGTPICECGEDLEYSHTEFDVENPTLKENKDA